VAEGSTGEQCRNGDDDRRKHFAALEGLAVIESKAPVKEAAALMSKPYTDLVVVCDHGAMVGVLTKTDIVGQIGRCMGPVARPGWTAS
jgi:CBS domain-containing protein